MKYSIFLFLLVVPFFSSAQNNFRPGYIVDTHGDTTPGFINYREWQFSPTSVSFKPDNNAVAKEYRINDVSFFSITGIEAYRRAVVKISLHPAKLNDIGSRDTSWKIDSVFLKVIYNGKLISLLSYTDKLKERFYSLEKGQHEPVELIFREYIQAGSSALITEALYKSQLRQLSSVHGTYTTELGEKIENATYEEDDLKLITAQVNGATSEAQADEKKVRRTYLFAGVGLQTNKVMFQGNHQMATNPNVSHSKWLPRISAGVDLFANPNIGKVFYRIEAGYQVNQSTITATLPDKVKSVYELSISTVSLRAQVNYSLYNSRKLKTPLGVGVVYSYMSFPNNHYKKVYTDGNENNHVDNWLDLRKSTTTFFASASMIFHNNIHASFMYSPRVRLTKTTAYDLSTNNIQVQIYYLFGRK